MQVGDDYELELFLLKILYHSGEVGEGGFVDGERPVFVLEVDVQPEDVGGDAVFTQAFSHAEELRFWSIGVARLLEAERPERRQGRRAGEPSPGVDNLFWVGTVEEVVVDGAVERAKV